MFSDMSVDNIEGMSANKILEESSNERFNEGEEEIEFDLNDSKEDGIVNDAEEIHFSEII